MALIEIRGLVKRFGGETVLDGVDLDIHRQELLTIIGPSGCGKSVLLKCLIGIIRPDAGSIVFDGEEPDGAALEKLHDSAHRNCFVANSLNADVRVEPT